MAPQSNPIDPQWREHARLVGDDLKQYLNGRGVVPVEWLSVKQAAAYLGFPTTKAFRDFTSQVGKNAPKPNAKLGPRRLRFKRSDLDAWMDGEKS